MKTLREELNSPHPSGGSKAGLKTEWLAVVLVVAVAVLLVPAATPLLGQQAAQPTATSVPDVKCVIGLENIKTNAKGTLSIQGSALRFEKDKEKAEIPIASIQDIFLGNESRQNITGAGKVVTMAIPYGGGRLLSLFSHKVEVMTVDYTDSNGGFHGAVFVLPPGQATAMKNQLVALGAKTTPHAEAPPEPKEQKQ